MFLAKLLIGNDVNMNRDESARKANECRALTVPPINPRTNLKYNTVTGNTGGSQVWVVYENGRAYPDYLVRYYRGKRDPKRTPYQSKKKALIAKPLKKPDNTAYISDDSDEDDLELGATAASSKAMMTWEFSDNSAWKEYGQLHQVKIEGAYQVFLGNPSMKTTIIKSDEWTYEVDLDAMVQTNIQHQDRTRRDIRRRLSV